jgi:signal peptidase II
VLVAISIVVLAADQVTKALAVQFLDGRAVSLGPVSVAVSRNTGGPFGVAASASTFWIILAVLGGVVAVRAAFVVERVDGATVAVAIVAGGVFGNLIDRIARGWGGGAVGVVDWISVAPYPFVFNLADVALRGGAVALIVVLVRGGKADGRAGGDVPRAESSATRRIDRPQAIEAERGH